MQQQLLILIVIAVLYTYTLGVGRFHGGDKIICFDNMARAIVETLVYLTKRKTVD